MKKITRLTESDLTRLVKKIIKEDEDEDFHTDKLLDVSGKITDLLTGMDIIDEDELYDMSFEELVDEVRKLNKKKISTRFPIFALACACELLQFINNRQCLKTFCIIIEAQRDFMIEPTKDNQKRLLGIQEYYYEWLESLQDVGDLITEPLSRILFKFFNGEIYFKRKEAVYCLNRRFEQMEIIELYAIQIDRLLRRGIKGPRILKLLELTVFGPHPIETRLDPAAA
jgi:hypothetical protein